MRDEIKDFVDIIAYIERHGVVWDETIRMAEEKHGFAGIGHILARKFNTPPFDEITFRAMGFDRAV